MAEVRAFCGIRYNPEKVEISKVVAQPYDKITPEMQDDYYKKSEYNIVRLTLPKEENRYEIARKRFEEWLREGILIQDREPAFYVYHQEFTIPGTDKRVVRKGFIGLLRLYDFEEKVVFPHEKILAKPKEDRLRMLRTTGVNFESVFLLYPDEKNEIQSIFEEFINGKPPEIEVEESYEPGVIHRLWTCFDKGILEKVQKLMEDKTLLIADGHHRYTSSLLYSKEEPAARYRMVTFCSMNDPGLKILPTHRAIYGVDTENLPQRLEKYFNVEKLRGKGELLKRMEAEGNAIGMYWRGGYYLLTLKDEKMMDEVMGDVPGALKMLDVNILHELAIERVLGISKKKVEMKENIDYLRYLDEGIKGVDTGKYGVLFILNPPDVMKIKEVVESGEVMPQKSTDFYPKLVSGLIMYRFK